MCFVSVQEKKEGRDCYISAFPTNALALAVPYSGKLSRNSSFRLAGARSLGRLLLTVQPDDPVSLLLGQALEFATTQILKNLARDVVADDLFDRHASLTGFVLEILQIRGPGGLGNQAGKHRRLILLSVGVVCHNLFSLL